MTRTVLAVLSDLHSGHRLGLMNPGVILPREDADGKLQPFTPELTASQIYLWKIFTAHVARCTEIAGGDNLVVLLTGDILQGNKYVSSWVSTRLSDQVTIAAANLAPFYRTPGLIKVRIAKGTSAHNFGEGSGEYILTELLSARYPAVDTKMVNHGLLTINGVSIDYAHHGPGPGNREWLKGNVARFYLRDLMFRDILSMRKPPDLVFRAHYHTPVKETLDMMGHESTLIVTPSYCMVDDHAQQAAKSPDTVTHGCVVVVIEDGKITNLDRLYESTDIRTREEI